MNLFFTRIIAVFTSIITMLTAIICPPEKITPEFPEATQKVKTAFDEGEFEPGENDLIVAPYGDDNNSGTLEAPLKTFEKAKEILKSCNSDDTVTVWFREGTYFIENTVEFTSEDRDNVIYRSYPDEEVAFTGARTISGWSETTINGVNAFVTDIEIRSDEDYFRSLFKDGKRLSRPNYPKTGVLKIADPKTDEAMVPDFNESFFTNSAVFYAHKQDVHNFSNLQDVDVRIMHFWCDELLPVHSIDTETGRVETQKPTAMTVRVDDNYIFENVKEALGQPGEWYLDRSEGKLYYIPEEGDTVESTTLYAGYTEKFMTFSNSENITFQGINFEQTDWEYVGKTDGTYNNEFPSTHPLFKNLKYNSNHTQAAFETPAAINISASDGINFINCLFRNISYTAIKFENASQNCSVKSSEFEEIGANAIFIHSDAVVPATTKNIDVIDCHITKYGRIFNNAIGILLTHAIDCELSNNEIHEGWYTGISVGWTWGYADNPTNNIKITNNLIYDIGNGWLSDMGGIYTLGIQPDTVISGNVIYNVGCDEGSYGYGGWGIYLDEGSSGMLVENNLVYDCSSQTFHQHYGKDNLIRNNIFAFGEEGAFRITKKEDHNSLTLSNNILVTDNATMYSVSTERNWFVDDTNLYWDYKNGGNVYSGDSTKLFERLSLVIMTARGYYNNAVYADPLFKDLENRDFTLALNSPALETGFVPWEYNAGTLTLFK